MTTNETPVWCINAGKGGSEHKADDVRRLFLNCCYIAVGWAELGDLTVLVNDRERLKARLKQEWTDYDNAGLGQAATALVDFVHEMQIGDIVVYRPGGGQEVHLGRVAGPYIYNPRLDTWYPHVRPVVWRTEILANRDLSEQARNVFTIPRSLSHVWQGREEFQAAIMKAEQPA